MIRSSRERNRSCSPVSRRSRGRIAHPPSIISRARNHSLRFQGFAKTICKQTQFRQKPSLGKAQSPFSFTAVEIIHGRLIFCGKYTEANKLLDEIIALSNDR